MGCYGYANRIKINNIFVFVVFSFVQLRMKVNINVPVATIEYYFSTFMSPWLNSKINYQANNQTEETAY